MPRAKPRAKKKAAPLSKAGRTDCPDDGLLLLPDPEWCDIERLPGVETYVRFYPSKDYLNDMLADKANWSPSLKPGITMTVANVMAGLILPRLLDFQQWRDHAANFFSRLCGHRRVMHDQVQQALDELRTAHESLAKRVTELEKQQTRTSPSPTHLPNQNRVLYSTVAGCSTETVKGKILGAQLEAIRQRSLSPGADTLNALTDCIPRQLPQVIIV